MTSIHSQQQLCRQHGAAFEPPAEGSRVGIAIQTLHLNPIYGLRISPENGISGWYIWAGETSDAKDFFQPLCVDHLTEKCPLAARFLALPPGWRFLTDGTHVDVWYDATLIEPS